ncbi:hypothetical protein [Lysobacter sp. A3-1-A15]|uniref:hypothetical protein n=1 Tax=Novilysobacter viscosus TaxID=3098602 RepID=UPI002EDA1D88
MSPAARIASILAVPAMAVAGNAATEEHYYYTRERAVSATGMCKAATYDAGRSLRYRPIGIFNSGSSAVDISCALRSEFVDDYQVSASFYNYNATPVTVTCAVLSGSRDSGSPAYVRNTSVSVPAGSSASVSGYAGWFNPTDFASLSCRLPGGVEMGTITANGFCYYGCAY